MGDYGLKVSKDGYEVTTATDIQTVYSFSLPLNPASSHRTAKKEPLK